MYVQTTISCKVMLVVSDAWRVANKKKSNRSSMFGHTMLRKYFCCISFHSICDETVALKIISKERINLNQKREITKKEVSVSCCPTEVVEGGFDVPKSDLHIQSSYRRFLTHIYIGILN